MSIAKHATDPFNKIHPSIQWWWKERRRRREMINDDFYAVYIK